MMTLELGILDSIQRLRGPVTDRAMVFITRLGDTGAVWLLLALVLLLIPKTRRYGAVMAVSLALEVLCCNVLLKPLAARVRPCDVNTGIALLVPRPTDYSFPSGHTGASFAAVGALLRCKRRLWLPALALACLIAFSRLYLYVHYPSDVLGGILLGLAAGFAGERAVNLAQRRIGARVGNGQGK